MHKKILLFLVGLSLGVVFLKIGQPMLVIFALFLITLSFDKYLQELSQKIKVSKCTKLLFLAVIVGLLTESLAFWNNLELSNDEIMRLNRLYSPYLYADLLIGFGHYIPLAFLWCFLLRKVTFSIKEIFIVMGVFGILFEGSGIVFATFKPLIWLYAFLVHGSYLSIIFIVLRDEIIVRGKRMKPFWKKYALGFLVSVATVIPFLIWRSILKLFINI